MSWVQLSPTAGDQDYRGWRVARWQIDQQFAQSPGSDAA